MHPVQAGWCIRFTVYTQLPGETMTPRPMAERIEHWPIERLRPYDKNPRTHSDAQVAQIAANIAEFGFFSPVLVDSKAGILAGHGRLLAARKLDLAEVPVIPLDHLSETQKRAFLIALCGVRSYVALTC